MKKHTFFKHLLFFAILSVFAACGAKKIKVDTAAKITDQASGVAIWSGWVKDKGSKYDIELHVENTSNDARIIYLKDIHCFRGDTRGVLKHTFFNTGERTIDFAGGQHKKFILVCKHGKVKGGDFKIEIAKVWDNPQEDGATKGKIVSKGFSYIIGSSK